MNVVTVNGKPGWRYCWEIIEPGICRSCGAPILWCRTHHGKLVPVDPPAQEAVGTTAHFATCPQAKQWTRA